MRRDLSRRDFKQHHDSQVPPHRYRNGGRTRLTTYLATGYVNRHALPHLVRQLIALAAVVAGLAALFAWRRRGAETAFRGAIDRRPKGLNGIVIGAEGFVFERPGAPAVLLLHGAGDTPQTLRYLAAELDHRGFHVSVPLLPGHGRDLDAFASVTARDIVSAARATFGELRATHKWVGLIGLSMGGAVAVQLAAEAPDLPALGLAAPYLAMPPLIAHAASIAWLWGPLAPVVHSANGISVLDADERAQSLAYGAFTPSALRALSGIVRNAAAALPRVAAPTLFLQSRTDNRIRVSAAERAFARLGSREKRLEWISGAAHIITVDYGRDQVNAQLASWMEAHQISR
jgi:carboxylesterase